MESKSSVWEQSETVRLLSGRPGTQYQESDETNQAIIRDWVRRLLQTTEVEVEFVKNDGTLRVMRCTLNPEHLPIGPVNVPAPVDGIVKESRSARKQPDVHSIRVFDLDQQAWRSFRFDRLKRVSASLTFDSPTVA
jgi:hypothetical protein